MNNHSHKSTTNPLVRLMAKQLELSLPQLIGSGIAIVLVVSTVTVFALRWVTPKRPRVVIVDFETLTTPDTEAILRNIQLASNGEIFLGDAAEAELGRLITGKLLYLVPLEMRVGESEIVTIRIAKKISEEFTSGIDNPTETRIRDLRISPLMSTQLFGEEKDVFDIRQRFPAGNDSKQLVAGDSPTEWIWEIYPLKRGSYKLKLVANVTLIIPGYGETTKSFPVFTERISIGLNPIFYLKVCIKDYWQWIVNTVIGSGVIGLIVAVIKRRNKKKGLQRSHKSRRARK